MKKNLLILLLAFGITGAITNNINAQTAVVINFAEAEDTLTGLCPPPVNILFLINGVTTGYGPTDSVTIYTNFGDGSDTTFMANPMQFYASFSHTYTMPGFYSTQFIVTGIDGNADTVINMNEIMIGDSCGNISGNVYVDANNDCIFNGGDNVSPGTPVELIYSGTTIAWSYTDINGDYFFNVPSGNTYTIQVGSQITNYGYSVTCPPSGQISVSVVPSSGNDFGLDCLAGFDLQGYIYGWGFRPGFIGYIYPPAFNAHCTPVSGQAKLVINDPNLTYTGTTNFPPDLISGDTLIWNFTNLNNIGYWYWWNNVVGGVQVLTSLNAAIGDTVCVTLIVEPITGDANPANNTVTTCWAVRNAWDPNDKQVSPTGIGANGYVVPDTEFTYTIRFQNTGTDTAYNVFILDTLDVDLDAGTFQTIASSHDMQPDILPGNIVKFTFNNIMLVDSVMNEPLSHGTVSYKIRTKSGLAHGTQITNTAGIYFDFNPPVITNTTLNTIDIFIGLNETGSVKFEANVFPNPATSDITLNLTLANAEAVKVELIDMTGKLITSSQINFGKGANTFRMDLSRYAAGIYFVKLNSENLNHIEKIVKMN